MIHVIATLTVVPGKRTPFLAEFRRIVAPTLAEDGCLGYRPTIDVGEAIHPRQVLARPDVVTVVEAWRDLAALRAHLAAPHMAAYRERVKDLVVSGALQITEDAG
jgi:quinol monooxygenase YgiN